jgi:outer membrane protein assembly factor BamB
MINARTLGTALALLVAHLILATAAADNWPGWRGPNRTGVTEDLGAPVTWSKSSGVVWKRPLRGQGISNPIVWNDRVFCTSSDGPDQRDLHVFALDFQTGRQLWHAPLWGTAPTLHHETKSSMASPSPMTDGRSVFAFFGSGDVFAFDLDGRLLWHRSLADEYGAFENRFAASSSPVLFEDLLILQCDHYGASYVLAIDKQSGADRWKVDRPEVWLSWSSPVIARVPATSLDELIVCGSEKVDAFDPRSGATLWTLRGMARECIPTPVVGHGLIYVTSGPAGTTYAIRPGGRGDVTDSHVAWSFPRGNPYVPSAILVADSYYLVDDHGVGTCLDARSGKTRWRKRLGGDFTASPVATAEHVYFTNEAGVTLVLRAKASQYDEVGRNSIDEPVYAFAAISGGRFFLRSASHLWCLGREER